MASLVKVAARVCARRAPDSWDMFFDALKELDVPEDFLNREREPEPPRDPFAGWTE